MTTVEEAAMLDPDDKAELTRLEEAMWRAETRFDLAFQEARFAPDFVEFGRSGRVYNRAQIIRTDKHPIEASLHNLRLLKLDENTVLVTYNSVAVFDGVHEHARRSSIWCRSPAGWVMRFHQGTPYDPVKQGALAASQDDS
jgi:hypothetical protein